jgi:hypothetical protein
MVLNEWMRKVVTRGWVDATRCVLGSGSSRKQVGVAGVERDGDWGWMMDGCWLAAAMRGFQRRAYRVSASGFTRRRLRGSVLLVVVAGGDRAVVGWQRAGGGGSGGRLYRSLTAGSRES